MEHGSISRNKWAEMQWEEVVPGMKRKMITGENMTVAQIHMVDGFTVPLRDHINEQITTVISGKMHFKFGADKSEELTIGPGETIIIPANLPHEATMVGDVLETDSWAPRREDWLNGTEDYLRKR